MTHALVQIEIKAPVAAELSDILSPPALQFVANLHRQFSRERKNLLEARVLRQKALDAGQLPDFPTETRWLRESNWSVAAAPDDLQDRRVEITGQCDRKMMINALNSGASVFMADLEDALAPSWHNVIDAQRNLKQAVRRELELVSGEKRYALKDRLSTLVVRPRGWHLDENHVIVDGEPISASLFDFGLYFFHNAQELLNRGTGPYFYLPKLEGYREARLWREVFALAEEEMGISKGTIRATVLIETILAAFEMDEILYELRDYASGLNAGRWDYIFSIIKKFRLKDEFMLPDRAQITMDVPFMRAYCQLLVQTCHKRGAHAIGGMAAFVPSRKDPAINQAAFLKVTEDKVREVGDGFDGTWVAHPDLVPVAKAVFDQVLGDKTDQKHVSPPNVDVRPSDLLDFEIRCGKITESGLVNNISVALQYLDSWLKGSGAVAIYNLMEDAATVEISRSQLWQWLNGSASLADGRPVTRDLYQSTVAAEVRRLTAAGMPPSSAAVEILDKLVLDPQYRDFFTLVAYPYLHN